MKGKQPKAVFFIGIGGIGMSALARYYLANLIPVFGYDKTNSPLIDALKIEGAQITLEDVFTPKWFSFDVKEVMVIYTPAIPEDNSWLNGFKKSGNRMHKRAEALGEITRSLEGLCVAGTHGKSTTSAMLSYLLKDSNIGCNAFLGAIASNFQNNFLIDLDSKFVVVEADEYDRSFLQLSPFAAIITNMDPDHLDIYGTEEKFKEGFRQFAMKIDPSGYLLLRGGLNIPSICKQFTYGIDGDQTDFKAIEIKETDKGAVFTLVTPSSIIPEICIGINGQHNVENATAALALCYLLNLNLPEIANKFSDFKGLKRRFEVVFRNDQLIYIDDYAHHPTEIMQLINSVRKMFPNYKITGVFQPHLFSRTQDFGARFAEELSELDEVFILPIYPAREEPILGIDSTWLFQKIKNPNKHLVSKGELLPLLREKNEGVLLTIGAGDIDRLVEPIREMLAINQSTL